MPGALPNNPGTGGASAVPPVDPATGQPIDPATGQPIDPATGQPINASGLPQNGATLPVAPPDPAGMSVPSDGPVGAAPPPPSAGDVKNFRVYPYVTSIKDFVPLPNPSIVLRQTPGGEIAGAVQYAYKRSFIPPSKLFHYATDSLFRNPYGMAMSKACYPFFYWTRFLYEMLMVCVERAGAPPVIGRYPANARLTVGTTITGAPITEDAGTVMKQKLQNLRSFAVATFPRIFDEHGNDLYSIEEMPLEAHIDWITTAIDLLNREKMKAMFFPDKILESGDVGSYALAKEHTDVFSLAVQSRLDEYLDVVNRGPLKQFVRFNDRKCPPAKITYSQPNIEAMQGLAMAVVQAITTGTALVTQTQDQVLVPNWRKLADDLGIPYSIVRKTDGMDAMGNPLQPGMDPDQQDAQAAQAAQGGQGGPPPGAPPPQGGPALPPDQLQPGAGAFPPPGQQGAVPMSDLSTSDLPMSDLPMSDLPMSDLAMGEKLPPVDGDAPNYPGVTWDGDKGDAVGLQNVTGHSDVHSLHRHLFGDMAHKVIGRYHAGFHWSPSGNPVTFTGSVTSDDGRENIGSIHRTFSGDPLDATGHRSMKNGGLEIAAGEQGHGIAARLYAAQDKFARDNGIKEITTHADIRTGPYAWARQGFDFENYKRFGVDVEQPAVNDYKDALRKCVTAQANSGHLSASDAEHHMARIDGLKHSWDIANFDTGVHVPLESLDGKPGHLGKFVMTQSPYRQDYAAYKAITPDASSPGEQQAARQRALAEQANHA